MQPAEALHRIAFNLERDLAPSYRVKAFRNAATVVAGLSDEQLQSLHQRHALRTLAGVGEATEKVIAEALDGQVPEYLAKLEAEVKPKPETGKALRQALRGDCHTHSLWSDGGSPIIDMARAARQLGHQYMVLTDHSPRLTVANGLSPERLRAQFLEIDETNATLEKEAAEGSPPFRLLRGIEVDILDDGGLDQEDDLLAELDVVVASVHSKLKMESALMTKRMIGAIENPQINILGHCTGRLIADKKRNPSSFDAKAVFAACVENNVAVEINSRPERKDPPSALLQMAADMGCTFVVDTDAHAPGQLDWQWIGCERAELAGIEADRIKNTLELSEFLFWSALH